MQQVPTLAVPAQTFTTILNLQQVQVTLRQMVSGLFADVQANGVEICGMVSCQDRTLIVQEDYADFEGDLMFYDTTGNGEDPDFSGLGTRFQLMYLTPEEVTLAGGG